MDVPARTIRATDRIAWVHPREEDGPILLAAVRASTALLRPWSWPPAHEQAFRAWLARSGTSRHLPGLLVERDGDRLVGAVNLSEIIRGALQGCFLGYHGLAGGTGRGLIAEGVDLAVRHAFETLELHRVEANVQPANTRSIRLLERCGFEREGFSPAYLFIDGAWRDHERWARRRP